MLEKLLKISPVIPVVTIKKLEDAVPIAEALLEGGIKIIEITLRTDAGLPSIEEVSKRLSDMTVGAGTVSNPEQFKQASNAGSKFIVSPGLTDRLAQFALSEKTPYLPGVATISEIMKARDYGFHHLKLFPASVVGGPVAIKQFSSLFSDIYFCPTGGISLANMKDYLTISNVVCIGGSWLTPESAIESKNWNEITRLSRQAVAAAFA
ncbi:MAG: bifunctional 4-hydroxy-2-oxoglutarate aldolase/2-dehydro-3-deoxy-phosphogluconate aldolase [Deltaproteobacteria bacterium]|jgi:2-dehydro-3-deoxyphosphogluconate aldolase/(4S)-4-hydroxy-2-oxoglutarate aldolase|nr:bifunctional 4-hydroxy-2-oxoglutarate aldolase/2-dehydro-3-deoxy-phosphogluconate aldolase [Deltaproteobacteria bacterium]